MEITVTKLTDIDLLRKCAGYTTGRDCKMSLASAYCHKHSLIRSQIFFIELRNIPLFVASQFVRSHVGVQFFQRSKRVDRGGEDFRELSDFTGVNVHMYASRVSQAYEDYGKLDEGAINVLKMLQNLGDEIRQWGQYFDRYAPTDLAFIINAEAIINMAHKRLCTKASKETREIWEAVCGHIKDVDPDLHRHLVPMCIFRGGICGEPKCCGFNKTQSFNTRLSDYKSLFE